MNVDALPDETVTAEVGSARDRSRPSASASPGATIGRYLVIAEIGRGGMGIVYRAYDPKLQREVALKSIRSDALGPESRARLVREAQAMAKLNHPNVVAVYDVEWSADHEDDPDEGVVLAMEYVEGTTLSAWLREEQRSWSEIVHAFVGAGRGLAAAHEAGLLHRDFKPANVLKGRDGRIRVTDFGVARFATSSSAGSSDGGASRDRSGARSNDDSSADVLGEATPSQPDTANADRLTMAGRAMGTPAYMAPEQHAGEDALDGSVDQYAFCVSLWQALTGELPFKAGRGNMRALVELKRRGPPPWPRQVVTPRPIVEAIRRGLAVNPADRWPSMPALLQVLSRDPAARRRRSLILGAAIAGVVGSGTAGAAFQRRTAERCTGAEDKLQGVWDEDREVALERALMQSGASYAKDTWARIQPRLSDYSRAWVEAHTDACEATNVRGEQSAAVMDLRMACLHEGRTTLRAITEVLSQADAKTVERAHELVDDLPPLDRCADLEALQAEVPPPSDPTAAGAVQSARERLASINAFARAGNYELARTRMEALRPEVAAIGYGPLLTELGNHHGALLIQAGRYAEADTELRTALRSALALGQHAEALAAAQHLVSVNGYHLGRYDLATGFVELARGLTERPSVDPVAHAQTLNVIAAMLATQGRHAEAQTEFRRALDLRERALGPDHPLVATSRNNIAIMLRALGRHDEAEAEHRRALASRIRSLGPDHPEVAQSHNNLAAVLLGLDRHAEAEVEFRRALELKERSLGPEHPSTAASRNNLALALEKLGRYDEAEIQLRRALEVHGETLGPDNPHLAHTLVVLGGVLLADRRAAEAIDPLERSLGMRTRQGALPHEIAEVRFRLAQALWLADRDRPRALELARQAIDEYTQAPGDGHTGDVEVVRAWLEDHRL